MVNVAPKNKDILILVFLENMNKSRYSYFSIKKLTKPFILMPYGNKTFYLMEIKIF